MIRNIIFDVGKVLVSYEPEEYMKQMGLDDAARAAIQAAMFENPLWELSDQGLGTPEEFLQKFIAGAPQYEDEIRRVHESVGGTIALLPYAMDWILSLKERGFHIYILSNYSENMLNQTEDKLEFLPLADGVVFSYACRLAKPQREIYLHLLDEFWLEPEESIFLDDRLENIRAAEELGIHGIVFQNYEQAAEELDRLIAEF